MILKETIFVYSENHRKTWMQILAKCSV